MEQHAIPQPITSYEFKLVGEMTLNQFIRAAGGILIAFLINSSSLIFFVKWPIMLAFGIGGILLAFVPYQDRPLETWAFAFIKSIYSPTIFLYKKMANKNWLDIDMSKIQEEEEEEEEIVSVKDADKVNEFIQSLPSVQKEDIKISEEVLQDKVVLDPVIKQPMTPPPQIPTPQPQTVTVTDESWKNNTANLNLKTEKLGATGKAVFGSIPMPDIPEVPNLIVGMATNMEGKIIDGVIIEIQDEHGNPSRVLKTNSLGQFKTSTPLINGRYLIIADKEGYKFDRVNIDLSGQIVQPIRIIASS